MENKEAILAYSQSEKAKAGLIMASQLLEIYNGMPDHERHAAERFLRPLIAMIANEVHLSKKMTSAEMWASYAGRIPPSRLGSGRLDSGRFPSQTGGPGGWGRCRSGIGSSRRRPSKGRVREASRRRRWSTTTGGSPPAASA